MKVQYIDGGVTAAKGFRASGVHCGIRKNASKKDLCLVYSEARAAAAAVYTTNKVKGAPVTVTMSNLRDPYAQGIICNSGNANTCNADGEQKAQKMCEMAAKTLCVPAGDIIVASTGVIGQKLDITPIEKALPELCSSLSSDGGGDAAQAIMTTDTFPKEAAVSLEVGGRTVTIGGMAKGSGMINPKMATMLSFITTDAVISPQLLQEALSEDVKSSYNMICVDGDTSTNDMCCILANGKADNKPINKEDGSYEMFCTALSAVTKSLSKMLARDGEGATKLIECIVSGARTYEDNAKISKSVISSSLVKSAFFGADANWGRILCAAGYSEAEFDPAQVDVSFSDGNETIELCRDGMGLDFSEEKAKKILSNNQITIAMRVGSGPSQPATAWGCDLTYDYVKINGDYRT